MVNVSRNEPVSELVVVKEGGYTLEITDEEAAVLVAILGRGSGDPYGSAIYNALRDNGVPFNTKYQVSIAARYEDGFTYNVKERNNA